MFGDGHNGAGGRNKTLYNGILKGFDHIIKTMNNIDIKMKIGESLRFNLGDLWDSNTPTPFEYVSVNQALTTDLKDLKVKYYGIPGNHDKINLDGYFAWEIMCMKTALSQDYQFRAYKEPTEVKLPNGKVILMMPFMPNMFENLAAYDGKATILFGHFSTFQSHAFAGIIDEKDPVFQKFELVVHADTHMCYDSGKFHTTGSMGCFKIDEMLSKKCIPSVLYMDERSPEMLSTLRRIEFPELKPAVIETPEEVVDDEKVYIMISDTPAPKNNIIVKAPEIQELEPVSEGTSQVQQISTNNVTMASLIEATFPEMETDKRNKLRLFCERSIELDDLLLPTEPVTNEIPEMVSVPEIHPVEVVPETVPDLSQMFASTPVPGFNNTPIKKDAFTIDDLF